MLAPLYVRISRPVLEGYVEAWVYRANHAQKPKVACWRIFGDDIIETNRNLLASRLWPSLSSGYYDISGKKEAVKSVIRPRDNANRSLMLCASDGDIAAISYNKYGWLSLEESSMAKALLATPCRVHRNGAPTADGRLLALE